MSTSTKGAHLERLALAILESQGYLVHRAIRTPIMRGGVIRGSHSNDVFGVADLVALKFGELVRFVQVGVPTHRSAKRKKLEPVARRSDPHTAGFEVWSFHGGRRPEGQRFDVQAWNGLEWADCEDQVCVVEKRPLGAERRRAARDQQPGAQPQTGQSIKRVSTTLEANRT